MIFWCDEKKNAKNDVPKSRETKTKCDTKRERKIQSLPKYTNKQTKKKDIQK